MKGCWTGLTCVMLLASTIWGSEIMLPAAQVNIEGLDPGHREAVLQILNRPTLHAKGPGEAFPCRPEQFYWFLEHPDRAVHAWRRLGAKCVSIVPRGENSFAWSDARGSEVVWSTVQRSPGQRIWYAHGKVKAGALLPFIPVKAVVVLRYLENKSPEGAPMIVQQAYLYVFTDSKSAALATKVLGNSSQHMAEEGMKQLQIFFSGLSQYLNRFPDQTEVLTRE